MRITVVGLGYVGLVTGACLASRQHHVVGVDADPGRLSSLRAGRLPLFEPNLDSLVAEGVSKGHLAFEDDLTSAVAASELVIVAVGTHDGFGGWQTDTMMACLAQVVPAMPDKATLVIRSTLPPGFARQLDGIVAAHRAEVNRPPIAVMLNPEFTREGRAVRDFLEPDRVVLGVVSDPVGRGESALRTLYREAGAPIIVMSAIDACLTKLGSNLFLATKISFANELASLCDAFGADVSAVVEGMSHDQRIGGAFLRAGVGFGGSCLPNQVTMTVRTGIQAGVPTPLLAAVDEVNHRRRDEAVDRTEQLLGGTVRGRRIALLGLTFKPDTDDLRDAPALSIAETLVERGATVVAYDPMATARQRAEGLVGGLETVGSWEEAVTGAEAVLLLTEWREFIELDWEHLGGLMARRVVVDGRNVLAGRRLAEIGFAYSSFGRGTFVPESSVVGETGFAFPRTATAGIPVLTD